MTDLTSDLVQEPTMCQPLFPESIPLMGCHLIEASAGTGKTYNITRIYLRLLLERKMDVKNILVMTFTRAATEELRGRIAKEIRYALENWGNFDPDDCFFASLTEQFSLQDVYPVLHNALLHLDEAAIFTIHSFCKRVLSQQAFSSGVSFNVQMETDTADIELDAVRDWYRILAKQTSSADYKLLVQSWATPETFRQAFYEILSSNVSVQTNSPEYLQENFQKQKALALQHLKDNQILVFSELIDSHKQKDIRTEEWNELMQWLSSDYFDLHTRTEESFPKIQVMSKSASNVFHGGRFPKKDPDKKQQLIELFQPIKQLKDDAVRIEEDIEKSKSYQIASQGIEAIRKKINQAKQRSKVMNYDDLINQLANALASDQKRLANLIRNQYPVALVDEFQDTDPNQYAILKAIYQSNHSDQDETPTALYLIGDPKQAIYAFRSGDVFTYLSARSDTEYQWVMDTNWRSSTGMINAYNRLFHGAPLDEQGRDVFGFNIQYSPVNSAGQADKKPLITHVTSNNQIGDDKQAALQLIHFPFNEAYRPARSRKEEMNQTFCTVIASWCASEIHQLLLEDNTQIGDRSLQEQDIAVLVRDKKEAAHIQDALRLAGYSSVYLSTHDNVFFSEEATELERVLYGILELENDRLLVAALSTRFLGCDTEQLYALQENEEQWEMVREQVYDLREIWLKRGFMAMALKLLHQNFTPHPNYHERSLTNAIQLLELIQQASQRHRQPEQLLNWLREQIEAKSVNAEAELRLESDANLIRIITQHGSKGLEYPVVFIPFSTRYKDPAKFGSKNIDLLKYHERDVSKGYQLNYFMGQDKQITALYREEAWAETVRLLYVAITRAEHRCYLCAAPFSKYHLSPLGQTLKLTADDDLLTGLSQLLAQESDIYSIHLQQIDEIDFPVTRHVAAEKTHEMTPAQFTGRIERNWWLSSFSALTRNLRHGGISTPDRDQDEFLKNESSQTGSEDDLRFSLTKGAATGNLLHDILEHTDFSQPHWERSLERPLSRFNEKLDATQQDELIFWLEACLATPLNDSFECGVQSGHTKVLKLNELSWSQTLRETEFYFPMEHVKPHKLGELLVKHRQQRLNQDKEQKNNYQFNPIKLPGNKAMQGMMHGFIDLIFQWQDKYYIVDYKSTHLGNCLDDYEQSALEKNVRDNYYDLQYLLYSLALHRYLKSRKTDYDPEKHFGGIHYLYLRGMTPELDSENRPDPKRGIFSTHISSELLKELDKLFCGDTKKDSMKQESQNV
ncbi:MAG: exodeoxyribonuclease V subunit beta [Gammaproteobacteria bacterium]|nr:exodeoxyribonuclease V subunit beta [Gammaproteobacteria bacterium]